MKNEKSKEAKLFVPKVTGVPGERTLKNLLKTAMMPMGHVLYIFGGGWNFQDTGASELTKQIGLSDSWLKFFDAQDPFYTYRNDDDKANSFYPYGRYNWYSDLGLDCSGYIGWALYNTLYKKNGYKGLVMSSTKMAKNLADRGWGSWSKTADNRFGVTGKTNLKRKLLPGDIISKNGHVWLCMGTCEDGSVVIAHSTPSNSHMGQPGGGVQLSALGESEACKAYELADDYMKTYYSEWYKRYPVVVKNFDDYTCFEGEDAGRFSWNVLDEKGILRDPDEMQKMTAKEVLKTLFSNL